jgi:sarcosine oxidase subunit alpha
MDADLIVIGSGPAGLQAAIAAARYSVRAVVVDEQPSPGGRLLGQLHEARSPGERKQHWMNGQTEAARLADEARGAGVQIISGTGVWGIWPEWSVYLDRLEDARIRARALILATGAMQRPVVLPGWTLPGVMMVGAVQRLLHVHWMTPGHRAVVVGTDPLALITARQLALAGVTVVGIVPPHAIPAEVSTPAEAIQELARFSSNAPSAFLGFAGRLARSADAAAVMARNFPRHGVKVWDIPLMIRRAVTSVIGDDHVVGVDVVDVDADGTPRGTPERWDVDTVVLSGGLTPLYELAQVAGCEVADVPELGGVVPVHGPDLETSIPGVFVAGSITGIEAAPIALHQGELAGLSAAAYLRAVDAPKVRPLLTAVKQEIEKIRESAVSFLPNITEGRRHMQRLWQSAQSVSLSAPRTS